MGIFSKKSPKENQTPPHDEAYLLNYLANLTPSDIDTLVDIIRNQYSKDPTERSKSMTDYYELVRQVLGSGSFNTVGNSPHTRNQRYEIYDEMDESTAYISSALDILSDDATQMDSDGRIVHIHSDSPKVETLVQELFNEFEIEERVSKWARAIAKYGDLFIKVEGEYSQGVTSINDTIYPGVVERKDLNGKLLAFSSSQISTLSDALYAPWEFVHFRHKGDIYKEESKNVFSGVGQDNLDKNLTSAYGQSILRPAIKVYAQLRFVENMILLSRLTNSIRRNIFLINVGDLAPDKAFDSIANYARLLKKDVNLNIEDSIYSSAKHTINYDEDIFIPVSDPKNDVRIEQVGGDVNIQEQYDLEYLLNKLFSALKIPKAYLNYEQDLNARSTLIQLDIRYARSVSQLQNTVVAGLMRLAKIHLAYLGLDPDEISLDITLTPVSAIDEEARVEQLQRQTQVARDVWDLLTSMKEALSESENSPPIDLTVAAEKIMGDYLDMSQETINKVLGRPADEESTITKVNSSRLYINSDIHALYPYKTDRLAYERIKESIISKE